VKRDWYQELMRQEAQVTRPPKGVAITSLRELLNPRLRVDSEFEAHVQFALIAASEYQLERACIVRGKKAPPKTFAAIPAGGLTVVGKGRQIKKTIDYLQNLVKVGCSEEEMVSLAWLIANAKSSQSVLSLPPEARSTPKLKGLPDLLRVMLKCDYLNPRLLFRDRELPPYWLNRDFDGMTNLLAEYLRLVECVVRAAQKKREDSWHHFHVCRLGTHVGTHTRRPPNWDALAQLINAFDGREVEAESLRKTYERCTSS
jgi:hypothetical protein